MHPVQDNPSRGSRREDLTLQERSQISIAANVDRIGLRGLSVILNTGTNVLSTLAIEMKVNPFATIHDYI
jgi:hypothetical protein